MELELILTELQPLKHSYFGNFFALEVCFLCYQLLLKFSVDVSQTLRHIMGLLNMYLYGFNGARINFSRNYGLFNLVSFDSFFAL